MKRENPLVDDECMIHILGSILLVGLITVMLCSCQCHRHTATHDTVYVDKVRTELRWQYDSIYIDRWHNVYTAGDTVYRVDSLVSYRLLRVHDTLTLRDSIYLSKSDTTTVEVKKPLSGFVKGQIAGFWVLLVAVVLAIAWKIYRKFH